MRVVAYTRVSGKGQTDGDGPERQREAIQKFCARNSFELVPKDEVRIDFFEPVSGTKEVANRVVFSEMLEFILESRRTGDLPVLGIVAERIDRLARDLIVSELLLMECQKLGIAVYTADQSIPEDLAGSEVDPMRRFVRQVMGAAAELDKSMTVRKLAIAKARIIARGEKCGGAPVYGDKPGERGIINTMSAYRALGWSYQTICAQLNLGGLPPRRGEKWYPTTVQRILSRIPPVTKTEQCL